MEREDMAANPCVTCFCDLAVHNQFPALPRRNLSLRGSQMLFNAEEGGTRLCKMLTLVWSSKNVFNFCFVYEHSTYIYTSNYL